MTATAATTSQNIKFDVHTAGGLAPRKEEGQMLGEKIMPILAAAYRRRFLTDVDRAAILKVIEDYDGEPHGNGVFKYERFGGKAYGFQREVDFRGWSVNNGDVLPATIWRVYVDVPDNTKVFGPPRPILAGDMYDSYYGTHSGEFMSPEGLAKARRYKPLRDLLGCTETVRLVAYRLPGAILGVANEQDLLEKASSPVMDWPAVRIGDEVIVAVGTRGDGARLYHAREIYRVEPNFHLRRRQKNVPQSGRPRCKKQK